jgi:hypothetical protein
MRKAILLLLISLLYLPSRGQEKPGMAIELANSVSYMGYSISPELHFIHSRHNLYAGLRINVSNSVLPDKTVYGLNTGYRYILMDKGNVYAAAWAIYENLNLSKVGGNDASVNEFYGSLAAGWRFKQDKISVLAGLGVGGYIEKFKYPNSSKVSTQRNTGGWLRLSASYRLF